MNIHKKKIWSLTLAFMIAVNTVLTGLAATPVSTVTVSEELRGVWFSYLEWEKMPSQEREFQAAVNEMLDNCVSLGMNAVFVHVRPDSDAMYPSEIYPWSKFVTGTQGKDPGYDPLAYFIEAAHKRNLQFHAWINPFRVTGYLNEWTDVAASNPARVWLSDKSTANDRWVLKHDGKYYYNPSIPEVRSMVIRGVEEIVRNYPVDGIHFDDYFYPELDNANSARWFDKPEYETSGSSMNISKWRKDNINQLVRSVYASVKAINPQVQFGVSPEGYLERLESDVRLFTDVRTWMRQEGYVDYIMPQIYWGFEAKTSDGKPAPYAFEVNVQTWMSLPRTESVRLYLGLAMYKKIESNKDNNPVSEWVRYDDIMSRQVVYGRRYRQISGYCFYTYSSFLEAKAQAEVENLRKVFR